MIDILKTRNGKFPQKIFDQKYNDTIKIVCKIAGLNQPSEELIRVIDIASLSDKDKVLYLKAIMPFILSKNERVNTNQMPTEFQIEIIR